MEHSIVIDLTKEDFGVSTTRPKTNQKPIFIDLTLDSDSDSDTNYDSDSNSDSTYDSGESMTQPMDFDDVVNYPPTTSTRDFDDDFSAIGDTEPLEKYEDFILASRIDQFRPLIINHEDDEPEGCSQAYMIAHDTKVITADEDDEFYKPTYWEI